MRRALVVIMALLLLLVLPVSAASGSDDDERAEAAEEGAEEAEDQAEDQAEESEDEAEDEAEEAEDEAEESEDGRRRNRNRGGEADAGGGAPGGGAGARPAGDPAATSATVTVSDDAFAPAAVQVAVGGTVTWNNVSREHTVTANDGSFDSGVFDAGQRFQQTFSAPGSYAYRCAIHPDMTGKVEVGEGGPAGSRTQTPAASGGAASGGSGSGGEAGSSSSDSSAAGSSGLPALGRAPARAPVAAATAPVDVEVLDFEFAPAHIEVAPGTTVRWTLTGTAPHTVTSDAFDSGMLQPGETYEQTFDDIGTSEYRCDLHPEMTATVAVVEGASPPPASGASGSGVRDGGDTTATAGDTDSLGSRNEAGGAQPAGLLANTGFRGWPALLAALGVIMLGWGALVARRRVLPSRRRTA